MTLSNLYPVYAQVVYLIGMEITKLSVCWIYGWGDSIMADKGFILQNVLYYGTDIHYCVNIFYCFQVNIWHKYIICNDMQKDSETNFATYVNHWCFTIDVNTKYTIISHVSGTISFDVQLPDSLNIATQSNKQTFIWWCYPLNQLWRVAKTRYPFQKSSD
jgi:hypothetical protein